METIMWQNCGKRKQLNRTTLNEHMHVFDSRWSFMMGDIGMSDSVEKN